MKEPSDLGKILLVSPHLDDGVFGCGDLLDRHPGATVVTVFAGTPTHPLECTDWDRRCGFGGASEAMAARREEDACALAQLQVRPLWLDFIDSQYGATPSVREVHRALAATVEAERPDTVVAPLGLFHSDHVLVSNATLALHEQHRDLTWILYEDALYRCIPGWAQARLAALHARGLLLTPRWMRQAANGRKAAAVACYASQLRAFGDGGYTDVSHPERYWHIDLRERVRDAPDGPVE